MSGHEPLHSSPSPTLPRRRRPVRLATALLSALATFTAAVPAEPRQPAGADLAAAVKPFVDRGTLAGAVMLVADKDKVLAVEAVGYSDVAAKTPLRPDAL